MKILNKTCQTDLKMTLAMFLVTLHSYGFAPKKGESVNFPFCVYTETGHRDNHFIPSGWMGDHDAIKLNAAWKKTPHSGETCIRIDYSSKGKQAWAGIYWQNPADNWGEAKKGGFDLREAKELSFWARGENGSEVVEFKMGGISGPHGDSDGATIGETSLTKEWQKYTIDLKGKDLSYIIGGFVWVASRSNNPKGLTFYLDDIVYTKGKKDIELEKSKEQSVINNKFPFPVYTEHQAISDHYSPSGYMGDVKDIQMDTNYRGAPHDGETCIRVIYSGKKSSGEGWAGVYWLDPPNNWGKNPGGYDLTGAGQLSFWARGEEGGERIEFKMGGIENKYKDTAKRSSGIIELTQNWGKYTIGLSGLDLTRIIGGFVWVIKQEDHPNGCKFYLDNILYEKKSD